MFTTNKPKQFTAPGAKPLNSRKSFVKALNQSFDSAERQLQKSGKFKQTKLCLNNLNKKPKLDQALKEDTKFISEITKSEFFQLPVEVKPSKPAKQNFNKTIGAIACDRHDKKPILEEKKSDSKQAVNNAIMRKNGRDKLALVGQVDFCMKMHKLHKDLEALWAVYGKLHKILIGKQRGEHILLMRSAHGGPILQSIYYDFASELENFELGSFVRAVGNFVGENRLRTYKIEKVDNFDTERGQADFMRIQNVTSFVLLQCNMQEKAN